MDTQGVISNVLYHKTAIIKNVVAAILMIAIFVFEGCFSFATLSWNWSKLADIAFWVKVCTKIILLMGIRIVALLTFTDVARNANTELKIQKKNNDKYMKLKGKDFPGYIENVKNREIKIEAYKKKINKQLLKLEKKAKAEDRALYFSEDPLKESIKKSNEYCIKRNELELELTDEYIEKNYFFLDVNHYVQIDPAVFDTPVTNERENKYQLTAKTKSALAVGLLIACVGLLFSQSFWNASDIGKIEDYNALEVFIGMMMDLIFMIYQGFRGITQAFTTINNQEVLPYVNRNRILKEYLFWKEPDKEDNLNRLINMLEEETKEEIKPNKKENEGA